MNLIHPEADGVLSEGHGVLLGALLPLGVGPEGEERSEDGSRLSPPQPEVAAVLGHGERGEAGGLAGGGSGWS